MSIKADLSKRCRSEGPSPRDEGQPTEETEYGWGTIGTIIAAELVAAGGLALWAYNDTKAKQSETEKTKDNDSNSKSKKIGLLDKWGNNHPRMFATPNLKPAVTTATSAFAGKMRRTLGFKEKEETDWKHPYYSVVSKGDDVQGKTGRSASSTNRKPSANPTRTGSIKPGRSPINRRSYIPE